MTERRLSSFLRIMQVQPGLNVGAIAETRVLLRLSELLARFIPPATFSKKRIPNGNFFVARLATMSEAPFEDFVVRSAFAAFDPQARRNSRREILCNARRSESDPRHL